MRSHYCGEISERLLGQVVEVCGWAHRRRDHGGVIFVDLRDREGLVQVVFEPECAAIFQLAEKIHHEYVLAVKGEVRLRPEGLANPNLPTGKIEIAAKALQILSAAEPLPFPLDEYHPVGEETRLRYRYLDLRRPEMNQRIRFRAQAMRELRRFLDDSGFIEIETPVLTRSTPEGARDFLVPSRTQRGSFFALPQSPQQFKQLLMMGGFDRYYQIVRCFRDEDLRADRQPEFTQLDIETSFLDEPQIMDLFEQMVCQLFKNLLQIELPSSFVKMPYAEALRRFGTDRPDLRIPLELIDIDDLVKGVDFKVFAQAAAHPKGRVAVLRLPNGCALLSRKQLDDYAKFVAIYGAKGLAYIKVNDRNAGMQGLQSPILKFLTAEVLESILARSQAATGDILFFGADSAHVVNEAMGALRVKLGQDLNLIEDAWRPLWIVDFPMFAKEAETIHWQALHHPFTAPQVDDPDIVTKDPGACLSRAYDMVINGYEVGGGSVRIHTPEMQYAVFKLLGIEKEEADTQFGHLITALKYGCPPHGGIAFGLDRIIMLMCATQSIREVIAFPKTQSAMCPLMQAPAKVAPQQLIDLGVKVVQANRSSVK